SAAGGLAGDAVWLHRIPSEAGRILPPQPRNPSSTSPFAAQRRGRPQWLLMRLPCKSSVRPENGTHARFPQRRSGDVLQNLELRNVRLGLWQQGIPDETLA